MGIPSDKYQEDWKPREKGLFFTHFLSGTPARRQVTLLEKCKLGGGVYYIERLDLRSVL